MQNVLCTLFVYLKWKLFEKLEMKSFDLKLIEMSITTAQRCDMQKAGVSRAWNENEMSFW